MIQGISEKLDSLVQSLKTTGAPKSAPSPQPPNGNAVAQQSDVVGQGAQAPPASQQNAQDNQGQAMKDIVDKVNKELQTYNPHVSISVDMESNRYILRYMDPKSGEVIQQMPPEGVIEMAKQLKGGKSLMFDSKG